MREAGRVFLEGSGRESIVENRTGKRIFAFALSLAIVLAACIDISAQSLAVVKDTSRGRPEVVVDDQARNPVAATSALWRAFIWEAMPTEWLTDTSKQPILDAYQQNEWKPFFINGRFEPNDRASQLMSKLNQVEEHALDPKVFRSEKLSGLLQRLDQCRVALQIVEPNAVDRLAHLPEIGAFDYEEGAHNPVLPVQVAMDNSQPLPQAQGANRQTDQRFRDVFRAASQADIQLTQSFFRYSNEMNPFAREQHMQALSGGTPMEEYLRGLVPTSPHYKALQTALKKYRKLAQDHPQPLRIGSSTVRPGESGNQVRDLQLRLQQEGFYEGKITGSFDSATQHAVESFQKSHSLPPDGAMGKSTIEWLSISYAHKAKLISLSMRSLCESQTRQYDKYVRINIPQFRLEYIKDGKVKDVHRVIVGKASGKKVKLQGRLIGENQTPPLASSIEQVVVNPRWYVTDRIWRELAGGASDDPGYFSRHGYVQMSSAYSSGAPRVFQQPGPSNPLGQVKFEFPNAYAVFLHDTPKKHLFARTRRDFSHGCIRVEEARRLAQTLLSDDENAASGRLDALFKGRRPTHIKLNQPVPIVVEYVTVSSVDGTHIVFCNDLYGVFNETSPSKG